MAETTREDGRRDGRNVSPEFLADRAKFVRKETVRLSRIAGAGHYSSTSSAAEIFVALHYAHLRINPAEPKWPDRDRFVLSRGHAAIGLYPVLADLGFFDPKLLNDYTRFGSPFGDHPDMKKINGVDFSSGSLGHGLSVGVGLALAAQMQRRDNRVFCMLGDGELAEGQIWEAAMSAAHFHLGSLVAIIDRNGLCIDGSTAEVMSVEPLVDRFAGFGWRVSRIDGHDFDQILTTLDNLPPPGIGRPQAIIADTVKGRGVAMMEGALNWQVGNLEGADYDAVMAELDAGLKPATSEHPKCATLPRTTPARTRSTSSPATAVRATSRKRPCRARPPRACRPSCWARSFPPSPTRTRESPWSPPISPPPTALWSSRPAIPIASSTSASPRRTWSPPPPAWPPAGISRSPPHSPPSSASSAPSRSARIAPIRTCRCGWWRIIRGFRWASTAPVTTRWRISA